MPLRRIVEHAAVGCDYVIDDGIAQRAALDDPPAHNAASCPERPRQRRVVTLPAALAGLTLLLKVTL